jgi:hypothetical protein
MNNPWFFNGESTVIPPPRVVPSAFGLLRHPIVWSRPGWRMRRSIWPWWAILPSSLTTWHLGMAVMICHDKPCATGVPHITWNWLNFGDPTGMRMYSWAADWRSASDAPCTGTLRPHLCGTSSSVWTASSLAGRRMCPRSALHSLSCWVFDHLRISYDKLGCIIMMHHLRSEATIKKKQVINDQWIPTCFVLLF